MIKQGDTFEIVTNGNIGDIFAMKLAVTPGEGDSLIENLIYELLDEIDQGRPVF